MKLIEKGDEARISLLAEVQSLFDLTSEQLGRVLGCVYFVTNPSSPNCSYEEFFISSGLNEATLKTQPLSGTNFVDGNGNPDGGYLEGTGLHIRWHRGSIKNDGVPWNGCFLITLLTAAKQQLEYYQSTKWYCDDNQQALDKISDAINILSNRQIERFKRGVRGKHEK
jgi:hypothetical protein